MSSTALARAFVRWQHAAGPYWPYVCAVPFLSDAGAVRMPPECRSSGRAELTYRPLAETVARGRPQTRSAVFIDLKIERTLPQTAALRALGFRVIPVVQRWIEPNGLLPGVRLIEALLRHQPRLTCPATDRGAVFLLDAERNRDLRRAPANRFDNRYSYPVCRFPPAALLLAAGVHHATYVGAGGLAEDLREYVESLASAGIEFGVCAL